MVDIRTALESYGVERFLEALGAEKINNQSGQIRSCCPVHKGNNSSAFCYFDGRFRCFSECDKTYSIIGLVMKVKHMSYEQAMDYLEKLFGRQINSTESYVLDEESIDNRLWLKKVKQYKPSLVEYRTFDLSNTDQYQPTIGDLLADEHFGSKTQKRFDLRFCTMGYLNNRIVIPIQAPNGDIVGAAGRSVYTARECSIMGISKYLFTKGLKKGDTLYNYHIVQNLIGSWVFVVEGYKSVWRLAQWGYFNSVALMGANMTREQELLLLKLNKGLIFCGDNDKAGQKMNNLAYERLRHLVPLKIFPIDKTSAKNKDSLAEIPRKEFEEWVKKSL